VIWSSPIRLCHAGDETRLSLLGKAIFLEAYAGSTQAADLLDFVEEEHAAERYRSWLESDFAKIWVAVALDAPLSGLCRLLLSEVLAHTRQVGIAELFLKVQEINQTAVNIL